MNIFTRNQNFHVIYLIALITCVLSSAAPVQAYEPASNKPTLHELYSTSSVPIDSVYTLTETIESTAPNVYNIPQYDPSTRTLTDKYYELNIDDIVWGPGNILRFYNNQDKSSSDILGHNFNMAMATSIAHIYGVAIRNNGTNAKLANVISDFVRAGAVVTATNKYVYGGLINNTKGTIGNITGDFIRNSAEADSGRVYGGEIYNTGIIGDITGNFISNYTQASGIVYGGSIYSNNQIGDINVNFVGNTAKSTSSYVYGGVIENTGTINSINGDFINNNAEAQANIRGGVLYNSGTITEGINANFVGNTAKSADAYIYGGVIYNSGTITDITKDFVGNNAEAKLDIYGGAINNNGNINDIKVSYTDNTVYSKGGSYSAYVGGGFVYNCTDKFINSIEGDFSNNTIKSDFATLNGGIIDNFGKIEDKIKGTFDNNKISIGGELLGGIIYNSTTSGGIDSIEGTFTNNSVSSARLIVGGIIGNRAQINSISGTFTNNSVSSAQAIEGGIIGNRAQINSISGKFENNNISVENYIAGGVIRNGKQSTIGNISGTFSGNTVTAKNYYSHGGIIENLGEILSLSGSYTDNVSKVENNDYLALGGAIYHEGEKLNLVADNTTNTFSGNVTQDRRGAINNAIFVRTDSRKGLYDDANILIGYEYSNANREFTLEATNNGKFVFNDTIDGGELYMGVNAGKVSRYDIERQNQYTMNVTGDSSGVLELNNEVLSAHILHNSVTTNVLNAYYLSHAKGEGINSLSMYSGTLNLPSLSLEPLQLKSFNVNGGTINIGQVDVDLKGIKMGRIVADDYTGGSGIINVNSLNLLNSTERATTRILFADKAISSTVRYNGANFIAYSPIYKYEVYYDDLSKGGYFTFVRPMLGSHNHGDYNPAVLVSPVMTQAVGQAAMNNVYNYSFTHSDIYMDLSHNERLALANKNKIAIADTLKGGVQSYQLWNDEANVWFKPYASFENIPLRHGPRVNVNNYGSLAGYDTHLKRLHNGWMRAWTGYVGYNGSTMSYYGVDAYANGGLLGGTLSLYKGNFFNATTIAAGASVAENSTMYGHENMTLLMSGIGNKTGYNFEFKNGRYIIQPNLFLSYTFVNSFDYRNAAGISVNNSPLHTIQIAPGVKFIMNTKNGWQPYIAVNMFYNLLNGTSVKANEVRLPNMSIKPFVQYGMGIQKRIKDDFIAWGQAFVINGGRNGVSLSFGMKWALGRANKKELTKNKTKTEIKAARSVYKTKH